ncbi:MAG: DUF4231 domain-containing protein [Planctomycetaceae bacterium]|nr:DUF4231 domain-containing protein [Planctomycetaceae bacterium]
MKREDYPGLYQAADLASTRAQKYYFRFIRFYLLLLIVGTVMDSLTIQSKGLALAIVATLLTTLFTSIYVAFKRYDKAWYNCRAVAESVKTMTWRYMMKAQPYEREEVAQHFFLQGLRQLLSKNGDLAEYFDSGSATRNAISQQITSIRGLPLNERKVIYSRDRIDEQQCWYSKRASENKAQGSRWFAIMCAAQALALFCGLILISKPEWWNRIPISVLLVLASSSLTWMQTRKHQEHSTAYTLAAHEICLLKSTGENISNEDAFSAFVNDSENAFSREHTQWQARREIV